MKSIKSLKITTLADNFVLSGGIGQWGLSFFIELEDAYGEERKVVFDTSANKDAFFHNAKLLKIDFTDIDGIVISHGHGDHTAATVEVARASGGVKVFGHPHTFLPRIYEDKKGKLRRGGPPEGEGLADLEAVGAEVILSSKPVEVVPGLYTTGQINRTTFEIISKPISGNKRLIVLEDEKIDDKILDDQSLWADVKGVGSWVITGCAHAGPINTLLQVQKLGGFNTIEGLVGEHIW